MEKFLTKDYKKIKSQSKERFAYETLIQIRNLDIKMLWARINITMVVQGVLISFLASAVSNLIDRYPIIILNTGIFGLIASIFQFYTVKGGSFWVSHWEKKLGSIEKDAIDDIEIFRSHPSYDSIKRKEAKEMGHVSTRKTIMLLSALFIILWVLIIVSTLILIFFPSLLPLFAPMVNL